LEKYEPTNKAKFTASPTTTIIADPGAASAIKAYKKCSAKSNSTTASTTVAATQKII